MLTSCLLTWVPNVNELVDSQECDFHSYWHRAGKFVHCSECYSRSPLLELVQSMCQWLTGHFWHGQVIRREGPEARKEEPLQWQWALLLSNLIPYLAPFLLYCGTKETLSSLQAVFVPTSGHLCLLISGSRMSPLWFLAWLLSYHLCLSLHSCLFQLKSYLFTKWRIAKASLHCQLPQHPTHFLPQSTLRLLYNLPH
jgi:hypothetical protein